MSHSQWQKIQDDSYQILGELNRDSVPTLWQELQQWQPGCSNVEVSLAKVKRVDSAGMVMLIHLIEHAKKQNCHIMLSFVPKQLKMLFQLSNVEEYLGGNLKN
ncbi:STAS domain-containing protein [Vibrio japonicus]|uniref:Lipid asymmetry maintenance protein MlaB n=1 Tax=Vibrio japonicus TaxID=1824638 RepID=A0ABY5LGX5_9VIBR|nr:lipid asymmetry maintenance protein MlaB [Vibrio japonicus]UUM30327.1 lipid asymmetry maintenance protein MlaB [Vibrio japonicus]